MRVALIQHARENDEASPLGLGRVAGALCAAGHAVDFLDLALTSGDPAEVLLARVRETRASALGFSLMTPQYDEFLALARRIRPHLPGVRIVAGGPHACAAPEETLRDGGADLVVTGEGEPVVPALFDCLEKQGDLREVAGIAFLDEAGACVRTPPAPQVADLDQLPPVPWDLMRPGAYRGRLRGRRFANVMTARGCPYHCVYCSRGPASGRYRARSVAAVIEEVRTLRREHGIRAIDFADDIFTLDRARTLDLCEALRAEPGRVIPWRCETRVDRVDRPLLRAMRQAGCLCISFGVESGSDAVLKELRKGATAGQARRAFADCHAEGLPTRAFFMLGTPWETPESVDETIALARELRPTFSVFFLATPYPGSDLREAFRAAGWDLPREAADYRHFVEAGHFRNAAGDAATDPRGYYIAQCRRATREVTRAQLTDLARYPMWLRESLTRFTPIELITQAALRLRRLRRAGR
jgi:anaerobic magnesium-protoporphyrin IX monomethyl ester cyclase